MKIFILIFLLYIFNSCILYNGITVISKPYIAKKEWKDTIVFRKSFDQFKNENSIFILDSVTIRKIVKNFRDTSLVDNNIYKPISWYPVITCNFDKKLYPCIYSWYLITEDKSLIYELGLFDSGICIWHIKKLEKEKYVAINENEFKKNKQLKKVILKRFETEILPKLKPYFKDYLN
jgi:hypothetical protein